MSRRELSLGAGVPGPRLAAEGNETPGVLALVVRGWMQVRHLACSKLMEMLPCAMRLRCKDRGRGARARRSFAPET